MNRKQFRQRTEVCPQSFVEIKKVLTSAQHGRRKLAAQLRSAELNNS